MSSAMFTRTPTGSRTASLIVALAALTVLGGCDETRKALGQVKQPPDEFAVFQRAPLSLPPDYGLRPPAPGSERPQAVNPRDQARAALGQRQPASDPSLANLSQGERQVLQLSGGSRVDPAVRGQVNAETRDLEADSRSLADKIVFWRKPAEVGTAVDADKEAKRIRDAQTAGKPITDGKTPTIQRRSKGLLER